MDTAGELMSDVPVSAAYAEYRGQRLPILFGGDDWIAVPASGPSDLPDAFDYGEFRNDEGETEPLAKLPLSVLDGIVDVRVRGNLRGQTVLLTGRTEDGRISVFCLGPPDIADIGLQGSQYDGWTGYIVPEEVTDIRVEESRRA
ncbi:hypothetical protein [Mycolicibacterium goodii]|uniref:Uncharacterized protein n=2 Tax=Mycolicibacterium goodii TaxID=134601 RepID=A0ABS6HMJ7_MYCGD|nr:hypothetical protein [Mycolicibacterium goodii]MBU8823150.1 hypothetical protein [Mycolicibacterium goodii]MBU8837409.1 hypothetical protein [Mycolicibacterium goodii]